MKKIDISKKVMKRVIGLEKQRVFWWSGEFLVTMLVLIVTAVIFLWWVCVEFFQNQTWQLLTLFSEDLETVREFWRETMAVFWQELPQMELFFGITALLILVVLLFATRKSRSIIWRKINQLIKY